ncbi:hypothetical protein E2542_SST28356 [Spatholobus suberectus]|nr:hypothetical protein E2542_SST28356 [Spatholobus suberectus]
MKHEMNTSMCKHSYKMFRLFGGFVADVVAAIDQKWEDEAKRQKILWKNTQGDLLVGHIEKQGYMYVRMEIYMGGLIIRYLWQMQTTHSLMPNRESDKQRKITL